MSGCIWIERNNFILAHRPIEQVLQIYGFTADEREDGPVDTQVNRVLTWQRMDPLASLSQLQEEIAWNFA